MTEPVIFEMSRAGRIGVSLPADEVPQAAPLPKKFMRESSNLPELTEVEVVRHFTRLSQLNYGVDSGLYPLGSCTMKYNPKVNEDTAAIPGLTNVHPLQPVETAQGALKMMYELQEYMREIMGMDAVTLQPAAGAHGELTGIMMTRAYHRSRGDNERKVIVLPDSAHGTNPATSAAAQFTVVEVPSDKDGNVDLDGLAEVCNDKLAAMMITVPSTLGLFDPNTVRICEMVHKAGGIMYFDGANLNACLGEVKPGELGFDVMHINLHKTFATPHGGGGPGGGPVACKSFLAPFLPSPVVVKNGGDYSFMTPKKSIGKMKAFYGNYNVMLKAYTYIRMLGPEGLRNVSHMAVLNANYVVQNLKKDYWLKYDRLCMHEGVLSGAWQKRDAGVKTLDIAKRLMDYGFHAPTVYFPLIVDEAIMVEPTESEGKETLDAFIEVMKKIAEEAKADPEVILSAPHETKFGRLDEVGAAKNPIVCWASLV